VKGFRLEELEILELIEASSSSIADSQPLARELPKRFFEHGLVKRETDGAITLTQAGERLLFRDRCMIALQGKAEQVAPGVRQWLTNNGFVQLTQDGAIAAPTSRGQAWLNSLGEQPPLTVAATALSADCFARRRQHG
jgi:hypothetical protein